MFPQEGTAHGKATMDKDARWGMRGSCRQTGRPAWKSCQKILDNIFGGTPTRLPPLYFFRSKSLDLNFPLPHSCELPSGHYTSLPLVLIVTSMWAHFHLDLLQFQKSSNVISKPGQCPTLTTGNAQVALLFGLDHSGHLHIREKQINIDSTSQVPPPSENLPNNSKQCTHLSS